VNIITIKIIRKQHFFKYKKSSENHSTIICDILNHSQENFVVEIKQISLSCPDPIFFKNKYPNPILIQKNRKYPAGYPILILSMFTSSGYRAIISYAVQRHNQAHLRIIGVIDEG